MCLLNARGFDGNLVATGLFGPSLQAHRCLIGRKTNLDLSFAPRVDAFKLPLGLHLLTKFVLLAL